MTNLLKKRKKYAWPKWYYHSFYIFLLFMITLSSWYMTVSELCIILFLLFKSLIMIPEKKKTNYETERSVKWRRKGKWQSIMLLIVYLAVQPKLITLENNLPCHYRKQFPVSPTSPIATLFLNQNSTRSVKI